MSTRLFLMDRYINRSGLEISHKILMRYYMFLTRTIVINKLNDSYSHVYMRGFICPLVIQSVLQLGWIVINHIGFI